VRSVTIYITLEGGDAIRGDTSRPTYDWFMALLPPHALIRVVMMTSKNIQEEGKQVTTAREISKDFKPFRRS
jgi:hypothetical protein